MPQSHSSPGSSRPLPQWGTTAIVTTELEGLERQLGWARSMNSASCCTLQSLKNSGNDWLPVLKESKEISDLEKIQGSPVLLHLIKTVCIWAKVCGHPTILLFLSFPPDWSSYKAAGFACSCAAWSSVIMRTGEYISLKEEQRSALFSTEKMFFCSSLDWFQQECDLQTVSGRTFQPCCTHESIARASSGSHTTATKSEVFCGFLFVLIGEA